MGASHSAACLRAASLVPLTFTYAVMNGPSSHGQTVP